MLHSMVTAATKIFVPDPTVHVGGAVGSSVNGATTPSRSMHQGSPAADRATGAGACDPGPVTETGQAIAPAGASWRGIDETPAPVHAHIVQW